MITLTTLAESKWAELSSQHCTSWPGSSTPTAAVETRPRSARSISRASSAASAGWSADRQLAATVLAATVLATTVLAATVLATAGAAALAGATSSGTGTDPSRVTVTTPARPRLNFIAFPPVTAVGAVNLMMNAVGLIVQDTMTRRAHTLFTTVPSLHD